jgi:hypothetical protein
MFTEGVLGQANNCSFLRIYRNEDTGNVVLVLLGKIVYSCLQAEVIFI